MRTSKLVLVTPNHPETHIGGVELVCNKIRQHTMIKTELWTLDETVGKGKTIPSWQLFGLRIPKILALKKMIRSERPDTIFHVHGFHSLSAFFTILAMDTNRRFIFSTHYHGRSSSALANLIFPAYKLVFKHILHAKSPVFVAVSHYEQSLLRKEITSKEVLVVPNGVDKNLFRYKPKQVSKNPHILFVGRMVNHKNPLLLIEAMQHLPRNYSLTIIGDGPLKEKVMSASRKLESRIRVKSGISNKQLASEYQKADLFVLPSENEAFGLSVAEAVSSGTRALVYHSQALKDFVETGVATSFDRLNSKALASAMKISLDKPTPSHKKILDWKEVVKRYEEIYLH